ncbi:HNH endonuclease [Aureimonas glaciei]|uniref:HNH endonuclease n=1 Tax=Aureimonas glaciei TaxID=1776957 RepID=A0A917DIS0_9HYPH|nr:HNH endonuclease [Aureimonas glaciei]GGD43237.1 hypothetical protein GCM10011335_52370 [Aureimonas glaciei]
MKGRNIPYSAAEMAWLEAHRLLVISEYHRLFCETFARTDASLANLHSLRKRKGWSTGRTGHFAKGETPVNKGKKCAPGAGGLHPNARKTQFRVGGMTGAAQRKYKPIGTERVSIDGYRERKVHDELPRQSRWQLVHRIEWEAINGQVPAGMALKCRGDRLNTDPANWQLVPRAILPRLNGGRAKTLVAYDEAPDELKPTIMALAKLDHVARQRSAA